MLLKKSLGIRGRGIKIRHRSKAFELARHDLRKAISPGALSGCQQFPDNVAYMSRSLPEITAAIDQVNQECVDRVGPQTIDESEQPYIFSFTEQLLGDFDCHGARE